eukprot:scaffold65005_cov63-Phaeocystis_antarctica.AAC.2
MVVTVTAGLAYHPQNLLGRWSCDSRRRPRSISDGPPGRGLSALRDRPPVPRKPPGRRAPLQAPLA